jgi:hypothetical protein
MKPSPKNIRFLTLFLTHLHQRRSQENQGYVMIVVLTLSIALLGLLTAYMLATRVGALTTSSSVASNTGFFVSEAGLNIRAEDAIQKFSGASLPSGTSPTSLEDCFNLASSNRGTRDLGCREFAFDPSIPGSSGRKAYTYMVDTTQYTGTGASRQPPQITVPPAQAFAGLTMQEYSFQIVSASRKTSGADSNSSSAAEAITSMEIRARILPLFQFLAFYQNDLELLPGPEATFNGRIHTNGSLFLGANDDDNDGEGIRINGQITVVASNPTMGGMAGGLFSTRKNRLNTGYADGLVKVLRTGGDPSEAADWINLRSGGGNPSTNPFRIMPAAIRNSTGARVIVGFQRIEPPLPALLGTSDVTVNGRLQEAEYYNKADLRIRYDPANSKLPFEIRRVDSTSTALPRADNAVYTAAMDGTSDASVSDPENRQKARGILVSLMQPVLAGTNLSAASNSYKIPECVVANNPIPSTGYTLSAPLPPTIGTISPALSELTVLATLTPVQRERIAKALREAAQEAGTTPWALRNSTTPLASRGGDPSNTAIDNKFSADRTGGAAGRNTYRSTGIRGSIDRALGDTATFPGLDDTQRNALKTALRKLSVTQLHGLVLETLSSNQRAEIVSVLQAAIASQPKPIEFSLIAGPSDNATYPALALNSTELTALGSTLRSLLNAKRLETTPAASALSTIPDTDAVNENDGGVWDGVKVTLLNMTPAQIAAFSYATSSVTQAGRRCFIAPPVQNLNGSSTTRTDTTNRDRSLWNDRENSAIGLLQLNMGSLAVWNRDGVYVKINYDGTNGANNLVAATNNPASGFTADQSLFATAAADSAAPESTFQRNGYSASDRTEGGMVIHASVTPQTSSSSCGAITYASATTGAPETPVVDLCRFGFALTGGRQLFGLAATSNSDDPTGLTFVTDMAVYTQGNYNSTRVSPLSTDPNDTAAEPSLVKQPAAIMGDTLGVLSNSCLHAPTQRIQKFSDKGCDTSDTNAKRGATYTSINAAFLQNVDNTVGTGADPGSGADQDRNYNGGLENYPRFFENWGGVVLYYRGSFVSLGTPLRSSGMWKAQAYNPPDRRWDYDASFNLVSNLPPLPPIFRVITQQVFVRQYDR